MSQSSDYVRSGELLARDKSRLLIVDVQEKLLPHITAAERMVENCRRLIVGAGVFSDPVPVSATEQYPRGLGPTVPVLAELLDELPEKLRFSCAEALPWCHDPPTADGRDQVVIAGIETHVCVLQTAFDLLAAGFRVYVPADAVASRRELDWQTALTRLRDAGAVVTTTESVLFEWCEVAGSDEFKTISRLVK